jgi:hypothetical protein
MPSTDLLATYEYRVIRVVNSASTTRHDRIERSGVENWRPFVNEYRTVCTIPSPEMKVEFRELGEVGFPC